ncbi:MAG: plasmid pRiA4b ORF-3 family protein [Candidatus Tectomicrobia bacterium]|nr:plasmid pRiA4b ORF-3 family protein [Candidatus Tectomicrobia bacterium]
MTYLYDFGDHWEFDVQLERIDPVDPRMRKPRILETHGRAPKQ